MNVFLSPILITPNYDMPTGQLLTHFKISLITNLKILEEETETLRRMNFYARYAMEPHTLYTDSDTRNRLAEIRNLLGKDTQGTNFKNFSLDRCIHEHIYMATNIAPTVDVRIELDEDFLETVLTQLTLKQIVEKSLINDKKF